MKRVFKAIGTGIIKSIPGVLIGVLLAVSFIQPKVNVDNKRVLITFGDSEAYAAGLSDYSLGTDGSANGVTILSALSSLPSQGGLLHFKVGTYNITGSMTRAIPNVIIEGEGPGTNFTGTGYWTAGGNNWIFRDLAVNQSSMIRMGNTTGWMWQFVNDGTNPTWVYNIASGNLTVSGNLTSSTIGANDATVVVATFNATPEEKAAANFVLPELNVADDIISAFNTLPDHSGDPAGTKTGKFKVIGKGNINLGALLDFPPMQDCEIEFPNVNMNGGGVRFDSFMNVKIKLPIMVGTTNGTTLTFYPRTTGPDNGIYGGPYDIEAGGIAATNGTVGVSWNNTNAHFARGILKIDEGPYPINGGAGGAAYYTTPFQIPDAEIASNNIIVAVPPVSWLTNSANFPVNNGTPTTVVFNSDLTYSYTNSNNWPMLASGNTEMQIWVPGWYDVGFSGAWYNAAGGSGIITISSTTTTPMGAAGTLLEQKVTLSTTTEQVLSTKVLLNCGDKISVTVTQWSGSTVNLTSTAGVPARDGIKFWASKSN